jgi:hypothetical protein
MDNPNQQSGLQHEDSDISVGGIVKSAVALVVLGILTFVAAQGLMWGFEKLSIRYLDEPMGAAAQQVRSERKAVEAKAVAAAMPSEPGAQPTEGEKKRTEEEMHVIHTFPQPRLQYDDTSEMKAMLAEEQEKLNFAGKDDSGNIHIPIDQAIDTVAKSGLPPVTGTFTPVNTAPTSVIIPIPGMSATAGAGVKKQ